MRQKNSSKIEDILVPKQFDIRLWDTWEAPSLIVRLTRNEREALRRTFGIHWQDLDIHMKDIAECVRSGASVDSKPRHGHNVKVIHDLKKRPEGIVMVLYVATLYDNAGGPCFLMPELDKDGRQKMDEAGQPKLVPAKLTFERKFPESAVKELFNKANASLRAMEAYQLALWAQEQGNEAAYVELTEGLNRVRGRLNGGSLGTVKDEVERKQADRKKAETEKKPKTGEKKAKPKTVKVEDSDVETETDRIDDVARKLTEAVTGIDPGAGGVETETDESSFADVMTPTPVASASPTPAPKPKKEKAVRPAPEKKGLKDLASLRDQLPPGPSNGQNDQ